jgi:hypothetical protein
MFISGFTLTIIIQPTVYTPPSEECAAVPFDSSVRKERLNAFVKLKKNAFIKYKSTKVYLTFLIIFHLSL